MYVLRITKRVSGVPDATMRDGIDRSLVLACILRTKTTFCFFHGLTTLNEACPPVGRIRVKQDKTRNYYLVWYENRYVQQRVL